MTVRDELVELAELQRTLRDRRAELVERARAEGVTWRELSRILGMTENGLRKAQKAWLERGGV